MSTTPKRKPCPFCGDNHAYIQESKVLDCYFVVCKVCNGMGPNAPTKRGAAYKWNRRAEQPKEETK